MSSAAAGKDVPLPDPSVPYSQHQAEWERKIHTLDKQEREVHQTQLKLIREQTVAFVRDLTSLRHEVASQKLAFDNLHTSLDREKQDRISSSNLLERKLTQQLESTLPNVEKSFKEQLQAVDLKLRTEVLREAGLRKTESEDFFSRLSTETSAREQSEKALSLNIKALQDGLVSVEGTLREALAQAHGAFEDKVAALEAQHGHRLEAHGRGLETMESLLREVQDGPLTAVVGRLGGLETLHQGQREKHELLERSLEEVCSHHKDQLQRSHGELKELHASLSERLDQRLDQLHGRHSGLEELHASLSERLDQRLDQLHGRHSGLEDLQSAMAERFNELNRSHGGLEDRVGELHSSHRELQDTHGGLAERLEKLHGAHSEVHGSHGELADRHAALAGSVEDLRRSHAEALEGHRSEVHGRLSSLDETWKDLHTAGQSRLTELQEATANEFNDCLQQQRSQGRKWEAHHVSHEERLDNVETMMGDYLEKQLRELEATQNRIGDLQAEQAGLSRDKDTLRVANTSLSERLDCLEQALGAAYAPWPSSGSNAILGPGQRRAERSPWRWAGCAPNSQAGHDGEAGNQRRGEDDSNQRLDYREASANGTPFLLPIHDRLDELEHVANSFSKLQSRLQERVDYMEGMVAEEQGRLWQALDSHTHDLSSQLCKKAASPSLPAGAIPTKMALVVGSRDTSPARVPSSPPPGVGRLPAGPVYAAPRIGGAQSVPVPCPTPVNVAAPSSPANGSGPGLFNSALQPGMQAPCGAATRASSPLPTPTPSMQGAWSPSAALPATAVGPVVSPNPGGSPAAASCPKCGNVYLSDAVFCRRCGHKREQGPASSPVGAGSCGAFPAAAVVSGSAPPLASLANQQRQSLSPSSSTRTTLQSQARLLQTPQQPWPWPAPAQPMQSGSFRAQSEEEVERIACGRARYVGEPTSIAEVSKS